MPDDPQPTGEFLLYTTEDGKSRIECRFENETIWLSQALIAELFETTPQNITLHLKTLYEDEEINAEATCKEYLQVRQEGARQVKRSVKHYEFLRFNERAILSDAGSISKKDADAKVADEYEAFQTRRRALLEDAGTEETIQRIEDLCKTPPKK